jgi:hypothetical protein
MKYAIVEFCIDKTVDVVPVLWINGSQCYYPVGVTPETLRKMKKRATQPEKSWSTLGIILLKVKGMSMVKQKTLFIRLSNLQTHMRKLVRNSTELN